MRLERSFDTIKPSINKLKKKHLREPGKERNFLNLINGIFQIAIANIIKEKH